MLARCNVELIQAYYPPGSLFENLPLQRDRVRLPRSLDLIRLSPVLFEFHAMAVDHVEMHSAAVAHML